jgi:hypothetical protein
MEANQLGFRQLTGKRRDRRSVRLNDPLLTTLKAIIPKENRAKLSNYTGHWIVYAKISRLAA